jgi:aspartyl-tRNA(Asn)/glutamyl-tRNA(Gln) amidotransferase subunit C
MDVTQELVEKVANLASLELSETDRCTYQQELSRILEFVAQLDALDLSGIEGDPRQVDSPVVGRIKVAGSEGLRPDEVCQPQTREALLSNAPQAEEGFFVVPNIL